jgi:hypothetical protein
MSTTSQKNGRRIRFSREDTRWIQIHGLTVNGILNALRSLRQDKKHIRLVRACTLGDGIVRIPPSAMARLSLKYEQECSRGRVMQFVASSGAATRMFRCAIRFKEMENCTRGLLREKAAAGDSDARDLLRCMKNLHRLALFPALVSKATVKGFDVRKMLAAGAYSKILDTLLEPSGMGFADCPKGLVPFHLYPDGERTPFEEHMAEASKYIKDRRGAVRIHFTARQYHADLVNDHLLQAAKRLSDRTTTFLTTTSLQASDTDSPGLNSRGEPIRDSDGNLVFLPGGHGALLDNLNSLGGDLVFIRTIDNILPDRFQDTAIRYRKVLAGYLLELQERSFRFLRRLESGSVCSETLEEIRCFAEKDLSVRIHPRYYILPPSRKTAWLFERLNRPLRVCGVVRHRGEPGGGPFWIEEGDASCSLQMIEYVQVDPTDPDQLRIWASATHFNAADMICGLRDFHGRSFDLRKYADFGAALIATKSVSGEPVRVLEKPGLWNGSMSRWNSAFVQIPRSALHPVKSILDLLDARRRIMPEATVG